MHNDTRRQRTLLKKAPVTSKSKTRNSGYLKKASLRWRDIVCCGAQGCKRFRITPCWNRFYFRFSWGAYSQMPAGTFWLSTGKENCKTGGNCTENTGKRHSRAPQKRPAFLRVRMENSRQTRLEKDGCRLSLWNLEDKNISLPARGLLIKQKKPPPYMHNLKVVAWRSVLVSSKNFVFRNIL